MGIPTREKQTSHITIVGTGEQKWKFLRERNRHSTYNRREQVNEKGDSYAGERDNAYNNRGNRLGRMEIPTAVEKQTEHGNRWKFLRRVTDIVSNKKKPMRWSDVMEIPLQRGTGKKFGYFNNISFNKQKFDLTVSYTALFLCSK
jgi:hypothetical protein